MIHDSVRRNLQESRAEMLHRQYAKATPVTYQKGDAVFKSSPERQSKLTPKFSGPFVIIDFIQGNKFKIFNPATQVSEVVHSHSLNRCDILVPASSLPSTAPVSTSTTSIAAATNPPPSKPHTYNLRPRPSP